MAKITPNTITTRSFLFRYMLRKLVMYKMKYMDKFQSIS